jgi:hypothetical protein
MKASCFRGIEAKDLVERTASVTVLLLTILGWMGYDVE